MQLPAGVNLNPHGAVQTLSILSVMAHLLAVGAAARVNT